MVAVVAVVVVVVVVAVVVVVVVVVVGAVEVAVAVAAAVVAGQIAQYATTRCCLTNAFHCRSPFCRRSVTLNYTAVYRAVKCCALSTLTFCAVLRCAV